MRVGITDGSTWKGRGLPGEASALFREAFSAVFKRPLYIFCTLVVLLATASALLAPGLMPHDPFAQDLLARNTSPGGKYLLGTDHLGRDILSRLILGTRISLTVGGAAMLLALALGGGIGLTASAVGGWLDYLVFAFIDLIRAMPGVLLALILLVSLGSGIVPVILALGITFSPFFARIARSTYLRETSADYVAVARQFGSSRLRILYRHILPNVLGAFITQAAIILPRCIVTESVLSFLGLGVSPDTPSWGRMIAQASNFVEIVPTAVIFPVAALSMVTVSLALLSDGLRLYFDPLRKGGKRG